MDCRRVSRNSFGTSLRKSNRTTLPIKTASAFLTVDSILLASELGVSLSPQAIARPDETLRQTTNTTRSIHLSKAAGNDSLGIYSFLLQLLLKKVRRSVPR